MNKKALNNNRSFDKPPSKVIPDLEGEGEEYYYTTKELSGLLGVGMSTLSSYRRAGVGPQFIVFGHRTLRYARSDIQTYMKERARHSTSEDGPLLSAFKP